MEVLLTMLTSSSKLATTEYFIVFESLLMGFTPNLADL
jgi:hypothetical protein